MGKHGGGGGHHHSHGGGGHWRGSARGSTYGWRTVPQVQRIEVALQQQAAPPSPFPWGWIVAAVLGGGVLVLAGKAL
jgi:hypothetical protein